MDPSSLRRAAAAALPTMLLACSAAVAPLASADAGVCNTISLTGALIHGTCGTGELPTVTGGTIVPGSYDLTAILVYPITGTCSNPSTTSQSTLQIDATTLQTNSRATIGAQFIPTSSTYTIVGTTLVVVQTCPVDSAQTLMLPYSTDGHTLSFEYGSDTGAGSTVLVFTRR